jgi:hypothetical protein
VIVGACKQNQLGCRAELGRMRWAGADAPCRAGADALCRAGSEGDSAIPCFFFSAGVAAPPDVDSELQALELEEAPPDVESEFTDMFKDTLHTLARPRPRPRRDHDHTATTTETSAEPTSTPPHLVPQEGVTRGSTFQHRYCKTTQ